MNKLNDYDMFLIFRHKVYTDNYTAISVEGLSINDIAVNVLNYPKVHYDYLGCIEYKDFELGVEYYVTEPYKF